MSKGLIACYKRVMELRRTFLPVTFDPTGNYAAEVYDQTRAFIALTHAEIEAFIEEQALRIADAATMKWMKRRLPNRVIFGIYTIAYGNWSGILAEKPDNLPAISNEKSIEARLGSAFKQYKAAVSENHGIREHNLKLLLVPLSVRLGVDLDTTWIASMNSFAQHRGQILHQSSIDPQVQQPPDPATTLELIQKTIFPGLVRLDRVLQDLL